MRVFIGVLLVLLVSLITVSRGYAQSQKGRISYYSEGKSTSSGERFNKRALTCAHRTLPFGTVVKVGYRGKTVACRVNDRGPYVRGRVLDISLGSAQALGITHAGVVYATMEW